jgi:hypothetical protein
MTTPPNCSPGSGIDVEQTPSIYNFEPRLDASFEDMPVDSGDSHHSQFRQSFFDRPSFFLENFERTEKVPPRLESELPSFTSTTYKRSSARISSQLMNDSLAPPRLTYNGPSAEVSSCRTTVNTDNSNDYTTIAEMTLADPNLDETVEESSSRPSRRARKAVSYKEPKVNSKVRRGDSKWCK